MDTGVWYQIGLELVQVDIQGTVEAKRGGDGGDHCELLARNGHLMKNSLTYPEQSGG